MQVSLGPQMCTDHAGGIDSGTSATHVAIAAGLTLADVTTIDSLVQTVRLSKHTILHKVRHYGVSIRSVSDIALV